jgi:hypothetical protein
MAEYCTPEQVYGSDEIEGYLPEASEERKQSLIAEVIARCSRRIDNYVTGGRETDYFAPAPPPSAKTVAGCGLSFLKLPAHLAGSVSAVSVPDGYTVPDFIERNGKLYRVNDSTEKRISRSGVWLDGLPYSVTARWGKYLETPEPIVEACLHLVVRTFRSRDEGFSGVIGNIQTSGQLIFERAFPVAVKEILDVYRREYNGRNFGL